MPIELTRELAFAASLDAGNRAMWAGGRKAWSEEDANVAAYEFQRLWPRCEHLIEPDEVCNFCGQRRPRADNPLPPINL